MKLSKIITPQGDKILVLPLTPEQQTKAGIFIPDQAAKGKKPQQGEVLAISDYLTNAWMIPMADRTILTAFTAPEYKFEGFAPGDSVLFAEYAGDDIKLKDLETGEQVTVKLIPIENILGLVTDVPDA